MQLSATAEKRRELIDSSEGDINAVQLPSAFGQLKTAKS